MTGSYNVAIHNTGNAPAASAPPLALVKNTNNAATYTGGGSGGGGGAPSLLWLGAFATLLALRRVQRRQE